LGQAPRVLLELSALGGRVAVSQDQKVHLLGRRTRLLDLEKSAPRRRGGGVDENVLWAQRERPDLVEGVLGVALLEDDLDRALRRREAQRLGERPPDVLGLAGGLPLAVHGGEPAGVQDPIGLTADHLEEVLPEARGVERLA